MIDGWTTCGTFAYGDINDINDNLSYSVPHPHADNSIEHNNYEHR